MDQVEDSVRWLLSHGLSPKSANQYARAIRKAQRWCEEQGHVLATLEPELVVDLSMEWPLTHSSRAIVRAALGHYWKHVGREDPPLRAVRVPPQPRAACRALEEAESLILASAARARRDRKGLAVILGMYEALRREEIASLPWSSLREPGWLAIMGKGRKERRIPLHAVVAEALDWMPRTNAYVFPGRFGGHVLPDTIWHWVREVSVDAGLGYVAPHVLRHISLSTANDRTGDLRTVQQFAGHAKVETTQIYTRVGNRRLTAVVASLDY